MSTNSQSSGILKKWFPRHLEPFFFIGFAFFLPIYSEISVLFAFFLLFFRVTGIQIFFSKAKLLLAGLGLLLLISTTKNDFFSLFLVHFIIFFSQVNTKLSKYSIYLVVGILLLFSLSFLQRFGYVQNQEWVTNNVTSTHKSVKDNTLVYPLDKYNSGASYFFGYLGSGESTFQIEIKAQSVFNLNVSILSMGLENGREDFSCRVKIIFSSCKIRVNFSKRELTWLVIGGYGTWKTTNSYLEIRKISNILNAPSSFIERYKNDLRVAGFSFNSNAFGAQMATIGLLAIIVSASYSWSFLAFLPSLLSLLFSGSRGALAAFTIGLLVLLLIRSRVYKFLPLVLALAFTGIVIFQVSTIRGSATSVVAQSQTGIRSLNIADKDSARTRLEIWRLATKAWLENPRTFLIGTGDLSQAMKVKFDARSSRFGLTKDALTHAHNLWIQTAGESGLLGLCAMLWLWGWVILRAWRSRDAGALALLAAIFVINSVDYLFFYAPVHLAFWMAAAGLKPLEPTPVPPEGSAILTP